MVALNGNIHYQIFCGIRIRPENQLTNYKLIDSFLLELSKALKIQEQQKLLADAWKPYMKNLDTMYTDASCYESLLRFPTYVKLLWECVERAYKMMCGISSQLGEHRLRTKYNDIDKANLAYRKQRKHTHKQTRKMIMRLLALLGKILGEIRRQMRVHPDEELLNDKQSDMLDTITKIYRQQKNHFNSGDSRESIPNRIVSVSKPYIRPIGRGKETKTVEFGAKCNNILNDGNWEEYTTKRELARVRATAMEGSFGTQKEHYGLRKIAARIKSTEIMLIFFGIHTANVVNLARRESVQVALAA